MCIFGLALIAVHAQKANNGKTETKQSMCEIIVQETSKQSVSIADYKSNEEGRFAPTAATKNIETESVKLCQK